MFLGVDPYLVDAQRIIAYAKATNDPVPQHLSGELAPPVFAVVPVWAPTANRPAP